MGRDKMGVLLDGRSLLRRTVDAALGWADAAVVVAPEPEGWESDPRISFTLEDPPFGGPVAGIAAAVAVLAANTCGRRESRAVSATRDPDRATCPSSQTLLLAGDLASPHAVVRRLGDAEPGPDGVVLRDEEGWPQYLAGRYRLPALMAAIDALDGTRDLSVRRALGGLDLAQVAASHAVTQDLDTPEDLAEARGESSAQGRG